MNLNWLALAIMLLLLPLLEILALASRIPLSMPLEESLAIDAVALCFALAQSFWPVTRPRFLSWHLATGWFFAAGLASACLARRQGTGFSLDHFLSCLLPLAALAGLGGALFKISPRSRNYLALFGAAIGLLLCQAVTAGLLQLTVRDLRSVYDPVLYRFDAMLGLGWLSVCGDFLGFSHRLRQVILVVYMLPTIWIIFGTACEVRYGNPARASLMLQFLAATLLGYPLYYLMPALAPGYFFMGQFPDHLPAAGSVAAGIVPAPEATFRNAMPSLHTTWLVLVFLALRHSPLWARLTGAVLLAATLLATLGFGEHYAVDLIAALPLVLLVRGICAADLPACAKTRRHAVLGGAVLLAFWVLAVRGYTVSLAHPGLVRLLALASLALPVWLERKLAGAEAYGPAAAPVMAAPPARPA